MEFFREMEQLVLREILFKMFKDLRSGKMVKRKRVKLSSFYPLQIKEMISSLPEDVYILGVGYKEGDFQVGITGKVKENESYKEASKRELREETRLHGLTRYHRIDENVYLSDIKDLKIGDSQEDERFDDFKRDHVYICVYGSEEDMLRYLQRIQFKDEEDGIVFVWALPVESLKGLDELPNYIQN